MKLGYIKAKYECNRSMKSGHTKAKRECNCENEYSANDLAIIRTHSLSYHQ